MKLYLYTILLFFICINSFAQTADNIGAFRQKISVKQYRGKNLVLEAAGRVVKMEKQAEAVLFFAVRKENGKPGSNIFSKDLIAADSWQTYSLRGKLDKDADSLSVGVFFHGRGIFYFDHFVLKIDDQPILLADNNFETFSQFPNTAWSAPVLPGGYSISLTSENAFEGSHSLEVNGSNAKKQNKYGDNDSTGRFADVNGVRLYYEVYGSGEPLVLLHGNQQSIEAFTYQIPEFAESYKVIAIDTRGQGKSSANSETYTYDLFASDVNSVLDRLGVDSANVVGWSDGGNTGLILAMNYPKKVKKLVTMGACVFIDQTVVDKKILKEVEKRIASLNADSSLQAVNSKRLYTLLLTEPRHSFDELRAIACPVLVMAGENDIIKEGHTKGIAAHITKSQLYIAPKQTHEYPVENPASFNEVVLKFLKGN